MSQEKPIPSGKEVYIRLEWNESTQQLEEKEKIVRSINSTIYDKPKPR